MAKKDWQKDVRESAHRIWLAGLGAMARAEAEGSKLFSTLVKEGERLQSKGKVGWKDVRRDVEQAATRARRGAEGALGKLEETFDEQVARTLNRVGVPSRDEISALGRRVEELTHAVERLREGKERGAAAAGAGAGRAAGRKGAARGTAAKASVAAKSGAKGAGKRTGGRAGGAARKGAAPRRKAPAMPERITTTEDVTTTADVRTAPR
jgi:poly(hydroxyalkanoate) granule-associated protein